MAKTIPKSAKSVQSVFDNIIALNLELSKKTKLSKELKRSYGPARGICVHFSNKELIFGLERMVEVEGMTPEKYSKFKKVPKNRLFFRQEAKLPPEFESVTYKHKKFEVICSEYESWLARMGCKELNQKKLRKLEFFITQNDLNAYQISFKNTDADFKPKNYKNIKIYEDENCYPEGTYKEVKVNRYERNNRNRKLSLEYHKFECQACGPILTKIYGKEIAKKILEVHHLIPLSKLDRKHKPDYKKDLIPLCPNCHRIAHLQKDKQLTIDEIKNFINSKFLD